MKQDRKCVLQWNKHSFRMRFYNFSNLKALIFIYNISKDGHAVLTLITMQSEIEQCRILLEFS
jgi:hypothetical protein